MELPPHAGALPVAQPPPAGDRAAAAELAGKQQPPGNAGAQLVDDAGKRRAVINAGSAAVAGWRVGRSGRMARHRLSGTRESTVVMATDHAPEQGERRSRPKVGNTLLLERIERLSPGP
jgi:hypothetical protein